MQCANSNHKGGKISAKLKDVSAITIFVPDVDAVCEALAKAGVALLNGPMNRSWGMRTASFKDPYGYLWEAAKEIKS